MKKLSLFITMVLLPLVANGLDIIRVCEAEIDGISYKLICQYENFDPDERWYYASIQSVNKEGDIEIPNNVIYDGQTYCVTNVDPESFLGSKNIKSVTIPKSAIDWLSVYPAH